MNLKPAPIFGLAMNMAAAVAAAALLVALGVVPSAVAETPREAKDEPGSLAFHLSEKWVGASELTLNTLHGVVYYHGTAHRVSAETEPWTGTVKGDILYVSAHKAVLVPSGTLTVGAKDALQMTGAHRVFVAKPGEKVAWAALLGD